MVVLDDDDTVSVGSRAICYAKRSLDILDRLGLGQRIVDKGIGWNVGKVFFRDSLAYQFDLLPESGHRRPAFVNLQQYWLEQFLVERAGELRGIDLRWKNKVTNVAARPGGRRGRRRHAGGSLHAFAANGSSCATARAARCDACSGSKRRVRCSAIAS